MKNTIVASENKATPPLTPAAIPIVSASLPLPLVAGVGAAGLEVTEHPAVPVLLKEDIAVIAVALAAVLLLLLLLLPLGEYGLPNAICIPFPQQLWPPLAEQHHF